MSTAPIRPKPGDPVEELPDAEYISTRIISHTLELEGVKFSWWAMDEDPAFVTVSSQVFGSESGFARNDAAAFAKQLAEKLLRAHYRDPRARLGNLDELLKPTDTVVLPK